jgi:hypothetical protein
LDDIRAIGRIRPGGPWIGFARTDDGYDVVAGDGARLSRQPSSDDQLLALAIGYFEEAFDDPPQELEASQADVSALVRHVAAGADEPIRRRRLDAAVDAIDDGLPGDAVAGRLDAARALASGAGETAEQADAVDLLVTLAEGLLRG